MTNLHLHDNHVLDIADDLFHELGFSQTHLEDIAKRAEIPVEMLEREYGDTAHIALHLYHQLSSETHMWVETLPTGTISERYHALLTHKLTQWEANEAITVGLFSQAMQPQSTITASDISQGKCDPMLKSMHTIVDGAQDRIVRHADELILMMYAFHFLVVIFWLYDRTEGKKASRIFIQFLREFIKMMRPMMVMPMVSKAMAQMSKIIMLVFGGAKLAE